jgi:hypothetical protein
MDRSFVFVALLLVVACAGEVAPAPPAPPDSPTFDRVPSLAGVPDPGDDPAVVALVAPEAAACAGALLAPDTVLTARACVPAAVGALRVFTGDRRADAVERARGAKVLAPFAGSADVSLVLLDAPIDDIVPLAIRATGAARGDHVRTVSFSAAGKIVRDHVPVLGSNDRAFDVAEASCAASGGGPALDESTGEIVGILESGGGACVPGADRDVFARADRALPSVEQVLGLGSRGTEKGAKKTKKGPVDMGAACLRGAECAAGACVSYAGAQYCSRTCDGQDACPAHFKCMNTQENVMVCVER